MKKFFNSIKSAIASIVGIFKGNAVKVEPLPKVNTPVETPKVEPKPVVINEPKTVDGYVIGVDVSHHNGTVNFKAIKDAGHSFAYVKATEGSGFLSPKFYENVKNARAVGLKVGAYHFMRQNIDPIKQADFFLSKVKGLDLDLIHVCDWETHDNADEATQYAQVKKFVEYIEKKSGKKPMIYTGKWFVDQVDSKTKSVATPAWFAKYPLWISDYGVNRTYPRMPKPWTEYAMWQYTESGAIKGISGKHFDLNRMTVSSFKEIHFG